MFFSSNLRASTNSHLLLLCKYFYLSKIFQTTICIFFLFSCEKIDSTKVSRPADTSVQNNVRLAGKPNIVLILADDIGYEVPEYTGGQSYRTSRINNFAQSGMQFTQCQCAPLCSPSRVMLMTGKYNFRNYVDWGILDPAQHTIANMLQDAGYATCVAGKWQLDGGDASIKKFGFDSYRVFLPFTPPTVEEENAENWYRYKNPHIYEKGDFLPDSETLNKYADNMFVNYIKNFIDKNSSKPFFIYYPMSLCHYPFCPTPDDPEYSTWTPESHITDTSYFPSMVKYMDKKLQEIINKINSKGLASNTVILFFGDNGTPKQINSSWRGKIIRGGKGTTIQYGTHVPLIINWFGHLTAGTVNNNIINFPDFMPTIADIAGIPVPLNYGIIDGVSFYSSMFNVKDIIRTWGFCHYKPYATSKLARWDQTLNYKLYDSVNNSKFYNILIDTLEEFPIKNKNLTDEEKIIKQQLQDVLNQRHN